MPAARKYTDAQRAAMYSLWEQGLEAAEIARRCSAGLASVDAFEIPRRTVHSICTKIDAERDAPSTLDEAAQAAAEGRSLERVRALVNDQLVRLEAKGRERELTAEELEKAERIAGIDVSLERRQRRRKAWRDSREQGNASGSPCSPALERVAAIMEARERQAEKEVTAAREASQAAPSKAEGRDGAIVHDETEGDRADAPEGEAAGFSHARAHPDSNGEADVERAQESAVQARELPATKPNGREFWNRVNELSQHMPRSEARRKALEEGLMP